MCLVTGTPVLHDPCLAGTVTKDFGSTKLRPFCIALDNVQRLSRSSARTEPLCVTVDYGIRKHKIDTMTSNSIKRTDDLEQNFQVAAASLDGMASFDSADTDQFGFPMTAPSTPQGNSPDKPAIVKRELTAVSKKYDRDGKGYLNEKEQALRNMDHDNKGYLDFDQMLQLMDSLQEEQKRSSELIDSIRVEHKRAVSFKRGVIALTGFVVLLALANIGTSFVAVKLVKDMKVGDNNDLVNMSGERVGTSSKITEFKFDSGNQDTRRRHLANMQAVACANTAAGYSCELKGVMNFQKSIAVYKQFCPDWPNALNTCEGDGVETLKLNCNGVRTTVFGGDSLPPQGPEVGDFGWQYWVFPSYTGTYRVQERVYPANATRTFQNSCLLEYELSSYCPTDNSECAAFATYDLQACPDMYPEICGWDEN